ncbi:prepilin-type N-terminal cleavage/methylation domain-containing protein [Lentisphaerota bacterium ZTH]|nr:prepilin-type N-terminal cleavage/methylation domain-containing protein [Lentisphaerota bacterium]WET06717.1 prepilin-type N-terminal cleavage/methylation domain-containing protein [Lentisphaerota bacterium ZTH]
MRCIVRHNYTLVELIAVIVIVAIIATVGAVRLRRSPAFITIDKQVNTIKTLLAVSRNAATRLGHPVIVWLDRKEHTLNATWAEFHGKIKKPIAKIQLPQGFKLNFHRLDYDPNEGSQVANLFKLYPDGSGSGHDILLSLHRRRVLIRVSPLTGTIQTRELEDAE